jgi:predicted outer membrane repeat protein
MKRSILVLVSLLIAVAGSASAATLRVGSGCTYATPQLAFDAASSGDIVLIRSGNYPGPFTIWDSLFVVGGFADCNSNTVQGTTELHGSAPSVGSAPLVTVTASGLVLLQRMILRDQVNGSGNGGGLYVSNGSDVELDEITIRHNRTSNGSGAGVYVDNAILRGAEGSSVVITDNVAAFRGAGIHARGSAAQLRFDTASPAHLDLIDNHTSNGGGQGSGLLLELGADAYLHDLNLHMSGQLAASTAILIAAVGTTSILELRNSTLSGTNDYQQSGISASGGGSVIDIQDSTLQTWAGALASNGGTVQIARSTFSSNSLPGTGAAISLSGDAQLQLSAVDFTNNGSGSGGGALYAGGSSNWSIAGTPTRPSRFIGNVSNGDGGAISHASTGTGVINPPGGPRGPVEFTNNLAGGGTPNNGSGGAIALEAFGTNPQLNFNSPLSFVGNSCGLDGGAIRAAGVSLMLDASVSEEIHFSGNNVGRDGGAIASGGVGWNTLLAINSQPGSHGLVLFTGRNTAAGNGGSIAAANGGELRVRAPTIFENPGLMATASNNGGHISVTAPTLIDFDGWNGSGRGIEIRGGYAGESGGGMYVVGASGHVDWVQFGTSTAPNRYFNNGGGNLAIQGVGAELRLRNSSLRYGRAGTAGGRGAGALVQNGAHLTIESVNGVAGTAPAPGAAWPCQSSLLAAEAHCAELADNGDAATSGGGALVFAAQLTLNGVSVDRNQGSPAGLYVDSASTLDAVNVRVSQHSSGIKLASGAHMSAEHLTLAASTGIALELVNSPTTSMTLARSIVWANSTGIVKGAQAQLQVDCSLSQTAGFGTFADPQFASSDRGLYRLGAGSAALDLCPGSPAVVDLDGGLRPQGAGFDAGAFEGAVPGDRLFGNGFE